MPDYTSSEVQQLLNAYRTVIPTLNPIILDYLDLGTLRQRKWSCLTTNFHAATLDKIRLFDEAVRQEDIAKISVQQLGQHLRKLSYDFGVGYSLGICPWTDYLLHKTFRADLNKVVIILGHDWYPIVPTNLNVWDSVYPPLRKCPVTGNYDLAIPASIKNGEFILFFMNLYPDFREPFAEKTGPLGSIDFYKPFVAGFESVCDTIAENYKIEALLIWGKDVWESLKFKTDKAWHKRGFTDVIRYQHKNFDDGIPINLGKNIYKSFLLPHPAYFQANYNRTFREIYGKEIPRGINTFILKAIKSQPA